MEHLLLLSVATVLIAALGMAIWLKTPQVAFLVGIPLIMYFTLAGGWVLVLDALTNGSLTNLGFQYGYLFDRLFPVSLDAEYFKALGLYAAFVVANRDHRTAGIPSGTTPVHPAQAAPRLHHLPVILVAFLFSLVSLFLMKDFIMAALSGNTSAYALIRSQTELIPFYTVHQVAV